jgi:hypothetical protein
MKNKESNLEKIFIILFCLVLHSCLSTLLNSDKNLTIFSNDEYTYYQSEYVRVYFSYVFSIGFDMDWDDVEGARAKYKNNISELGLLFERGIITGEMFYDELIKENYPLGIQPIKNLSAYPKQPNYSIKEELYNFKGNLLKILSYSKKQTDDIPNNRMVFIIYCTTYKWEDGWGSFNIFEVEIESKFKLSDTTKESFLKNSYLRHIKYLGDQL